MERTRPSRRNALFAAALGACCAFAGAAQEAPPGAALPVAPEGEPMEEVTVTGRRAGRIRTEIVQARQDFYALLNDYIDEPDFQVTCRRERPTFDPLDPRASTRITEVVCRAGYMEEELGKIGRFALRGVVYDATPTLVQKSRAFNDKVVEAVNLHPELRDAAARIERLLDAYRDTTSEAP